MNRSSWAATPPNRWGVFTETFADPDQLYLRVVALYAITPLSAAGI
jgi:hypothetical protein